jgi:hypothetical protein
MYPHGKSKHSNKGNWQSNITFSELYKINYDISTTLKITHSIQQCPTHTQNLCEELVPPPKCCGLISLKKKKRKRKTVSRWSHFMVTM